MDVTTPPSHRRGARLGKALRSLAAAAALAAAVLGVGVQNPTAARGAPPPTTGVVRVGDFAPTFTLPALSGNTFTLSEQIGQRPVLLVFWSYFCFPCQKEIPDLQAFARQLGPENLLVVGVCLDGPEYDERVVPFCRDKGITFPIVHDKETEEYFETAERYGVVGTPTSFLLDAQGRVRLIHLGRLDPEMLAGAVKAARDQSYCSEITKPTPRRAK
ncbi:MAG: TlpA family protein disulfide reductase [Deltaproteobacteria bacterium]|nr:TlpA family protein disulfide reductase [Deltaproteobacteria bacterium]